MRSTNTKSGALALLNLTLLVLGFAATSTPVNARPASESSLLKPWSHVQGSPAEDIYGALAGSTIEVVRTQATYFTRAAAFGARVQDEEGLRGMLIPISEYYHPRNRSKETTAMHACPEHGDDGENRPFRVQRRSDKSNETAVPPSDWIALVERGGSCPFVEKVRTAQTLGAIAVVVGDAPMPGWQSRPDTFPEETDPGLSGKRLLTMFANGDSSDIRVPSTFITRPSFLDLERLILELKELRHQNHPSDESKALGIEIVISQDDTMWEWPLVDLALILLLLPSLMTVTTVIVHRIRQARTRRRERAPQLVVHSLPCLIVRGNGQPWEKVEGKDAERDEERQNGRRGSDSNEDPSTSANRLSHPPATTMLAPESSSLLPPGRSWFYSDECAICLSNFVEGDRVRVLPCGHIFHRSEIDDWLTLQKKVCPVCKRDITVPVPPTISSGPEGLALAAFSEAPVESTNGAPAAASSDEAAPLLEQESIGSNIRPHDRLDAGEAA